MAAVIVRRVRKAVFVDIDGVISPVHGHTAWGDDVVAGNVFGPVYVSPTLCARLDGLATLPHLSCWWLTSWTAEMRASMHPFPGRDWPVLAEQPEGSRGRRWWKLVAVEHWLTEHQEVRAVAWCDDALTSGARRAAIRRRFHDRSIEFLPIAPATSVGLTPSDIELLREWVT